MSLGPELERTPLSDTHHLRYVQGPRPTQHNVLMLLVVHNERMIIEDCMDHYRKFGPMDVIVIDDHSTDGTREYLRDRTDVTLFEPKPGTNFSSDKQYWRSALLDQYGTGRWCLTPDADERLVWFDFENRPLSELLSDLDSEGAEAYVADMVDMYNDRPLSDHIAGKGALIAQFPYFDDPATDPLNYRVMMQPKSRFRKRFPTPNTATFGGMRDRIFGHGIAAHGPFAQFLLKGTISRPRSIPAKGRILQSLLCALLKPRKTPTPMISSKLALLKWIKGCCFSGAQHNVTLELKVSEERGAYLHFPITKGIEGLSYVAERGQHASQSKHYKQLIADTDELSSSPVYFGTKRYTNSKDLGPLLAGPQRRPD